MPFIVFEGMDASGKTTQSKLLAEALNARRIKMPTYSTESGALTGPAIAAHLKEQWTVINTLPHPAPIADPALDAFVFQCVMSVNKYEMAPIIKHELDEGRSVVCDRYWPSAYAYGCADGLDPTWLFRIHEMLPAPDVMFLLDIDYEQSVKRRPDRRDRYEKRGKEYFDEIASYYRRLWLEIGSLSHFWGSPTKWVVLDGREAPTVVTNQVQREIERFQCDDDTK